MQIRMLAVLGAALLSSCATVAKLGPIEVEPTGGAGFAGLRVYEVLQQPALAVSPNCAGLCTAKALTDSVDLTPNHHYQWRPALSTGVSFQHYQTTGQQVGGGIGLNIVLVPGANGVADPWPAATMHFGTRENGFFAGLILSPTDRVLLPPGATSLRVQRDAIPDLVARNTGKAGHLYFGIRLGGKNQTPPADSVASAKKP